MRVEKTALPRRLNRTRHLEAFSRRTSLRRDRGDTAIQRGRYRGGGDLLRDLLRLKGRLNLMGEYRGDPLLRGGDLDLEKDLGRPLNLGDLGEADLARDSFAGDLVMMETVLFSFLVETSALASPLSDSTDLASLLISSHDFKISDTFSKSFFDGGSLVFFLSRSYLYVVVLS